MVTVSSASDFLWNVDMEVNLFHAMRGHKPAGVNRHFQMIAVHEKLSSACKKLSSEDVWKHLSTLYDLQALNESEIIPFPNKSSDFCLPESSTTGLSDHTFPRSSYINTPASDSQKPDAPSKVIPKSVSKPDSKAPPQTPTPQKSESSKPDNKPPSAKSQSHKAGGGVGGAGGSSNTPKSGGGLQSQALFSPDPSPKRTKRTRNVPSTGSSPVTSTEPASKRRR